MKYSCQNTSKLNLIDLADKTTSFQKRQEHDRKVTQNSETEQLCWKKKLINICPKEKEGERKSTE